MYYARGVKSERLGVIDITAQSATMSGQMEKGEYKYSRFSQMEQ
ncbi:hypothetical protein DSOL_2977 [Desulfosporosinus metallidurans]|uniref:Uncharacterized protein n=1 Tax=Desulfosporosinus metallidurans TaxID=1888891 RepID=A0A1Q8QTG0_9FIRM|nr:hypothetical protein DSOL_2977 [Desulfosporosinus metallidurans]